MKKRKISSLLLALTGAMMFSFAVQTTAAEILPTQVPGVSETGGTETEAEETNGWTTVDGKKKYLVDGNAVKGLYVIEGKTYVFDAKGILQTSRWTKVGELKYYSDSKGVLVRNKLIKWNNYYFYVKADGTALKNGWKTLSNGKTCYFGSNGARYTGIRKINGKFYGLSTSAGYLMHNQWMKKDTKVYRTNAAGELVRAKLLNVDGKYYYFGADGVRYCKKWKNFSAGKSYFNSKAVRTVGEIKIGGKLYYFNSKGYLETGKSMVTAGSTTYYLDGNGIVELKVQKNGSTEKYYNTAGQSVNSIFANNYMTLQTAKKIASEITTPSMSKEQKLRVCFEWVVKKYYAHRRPFPNTEGWPAIYANDHFLYGGGDCHADAAAFAYLAKAIGYTNVYVCSDSTGVIDTHSWTEINGGVYDPLFWEAKGRQSKYYGGSYSAYGLSAMRRNVI